MIYNNILETIGGTPHIKIKKMTQADDAEVIVKVEAFNPGSSVKDRIAFYMIEAAEKKGILNENSVIVEPTSGNTGIGLAMVAAVKGYKIKLVMPESMSLERRKILKAFGAEIILTPAAGGMKGAVEKAVELGEKDNNVFIPQQFKNEANVKAHMETTAIELMEEVGEFDAFIAGVGTGGTITGVSKIIKARFPNTKFIAVEPLESPVLSGGNPGPHKIQGIGAGFIPDVFDKDAVDEVMKVSAQDAFETAEKLAKTEGIFAGISSGANLYAALKVAKKLGKGKKVVTVLPDSGERYLSTQLFEERKNGI